MMVADISEASRMHQAPVLDLVITGEESGSEEDPIPEFRMADSSVLHKVVWSHEVVYTPTRIPAEYEDIFIHLFVSGYLAVMATEKLAVHPLIAQHLQELIGNVELYGWELFMPYGSRNWSKQSHMGL